MKTKAQALRVFLKISTLRVVFFKKSLRYSFTSYKKGLQIIKNKNNKQLYY